MTVLQILAITGAFSSLAGGAVLAVSLSRLISAFALSFQALELTVDTLAHGGDVVLVRGTDVHRLNGVRSATVFTVIGILLLAAGAISSAAAAFVGS